MIRRFLKAVLVGSTETLISVALVLVFTLSLLAILIWSFPEGTDLTGLVLDEELSAASRAPGGPEILLSEIAEETSPFIASLSHLRRRVEDKPSDAIAWARSREGTMLEDRHAVQTHSGATARITFDEENVLFLEENSLVVLKHSASLLRSQRKRASVVVLDGELRGRLAAAQSDKMTVEIEADTKRASIRAEASPGTTADFDVRIHDDESATFTVLQGFAEVTAGKESIVVRPNHAVTVDEGGAIGVLRPLPAVPQPQEPPGHAVYRFKDTPPRVAFRWSGTPEMEGYLITISSDPGFEDVVHEERTSRTDFRHGNLRPGTYFWRVRSQVGGAESLPSDPRRLDMISDTEPPRLEVFFPEGIVDREQISLEGVTEPGVKLFIDEEQVAVGASGEFTHLLHLQPGINVVVVEAIDDAGNTSYKSELVNAQF